MLQMFPSYYWITAFHEVGRQCLGPLHFIRQIYEICAPLPLFLHFLLDILQMHILLGADLLPGCHGEASFSKTRAYPWWESEGAEHDYFLMETGQLLYFISFTNLYDLTTLKQRHPICWSVLPSFLNKMDNGNMRKNDI